MIEAAAEANDTLMHKYLEHEELSRGRDPPGPARALDQERGRARHVRLAFKNKGVQALLDAIIEFMPSPVDMPEVKGMNEAGRARHPQGERRRSRSRRSPSRS